MRAIPDEFWPGFLRCVARLDQLRRASKLLVMLRARGAGKAVAKSRTRQNRVPSGLPALPTVSAASERCLLSGLLGHGGLVTTGARGRPRARPLVTAANMWILRRGRQNRVLPRPLPLREVRVHSLNTSGPKNLGGDMPGGRKPLWPHTSSWRHGGYATAAIVALRKWI